MSPLELVGALTSKKFSGSQIFLKKRKEKDVEKYGNQLKDENCVLDLTNGNVTLF
uniref:Uncharacterized protein n=1 Tax=Rhizophora mucronata TaxID=61149 RepID=A0A2P2QG30_RHIMU